MMITAVTLAASAVDKRLVVIVSVWSMTVGGPSGQTVN